MNHFGKRMICGVLTAVMLFSAVPAVSAYTGVYDWAVEGVSAMEDLELIPQSLMDADMRENISRLDMSRIAVLAYEKITGEPISLPQEHPFPDTTDPDMEKAWVVGLIRGDDTGTARPNGDLTRLEFFIIAHRFLEILNYPFTDANRDDLSRFADSKTLPAWGRNATELTVGLNIVSGSGNMLNWSSCTSRQEGILLFYRAYQTALTLFPEVPEESIPEETVPEETTPEESVPEETVPEESEPESDGAFIDLADWAKEAVTSMDEKALIPEQVKSASMAGIITRQDMCQVMMRTYKYIMGVSDSELNTDAHPFTDTDDQDVRNAYQLGIVSGKGDGIFAPNDPITRQDFFVMSVRFLNALGYPYADDPSVSLNRFSDASKVASYARGYTRLLVGLGLVAGSGDKLNPRDDIVSQEALVIFNRIYEFVVAWDGEAPSVSKAQQVVDLAMNYLGYDYVYAGKKPETGFDCSGFVYYCYRRFGYDVSAGSKNQWNEIGGPTYFGDDLKVGDVLFFSSNGKSSGIHHVGLYIGNGEMIHAATSDKGVIISSLSENYYAKRFIGGKRVINE